MERVTEIQHPLVKHHLTRLRNKDISPPSFRSLIGRLAFLLTYEATKDLALEPLDVETPLATAHGQQLSQRVGIVPILRAGLGMVDPILSLVPDAEVWHLGFYRDEETHEPVEYYKKLPDASPVDTALIVDPMLATGGSACAAIRAVQDWGVKDLRLLGIIAAPEGIDAVTQAFPEIRIFVCGIDDCLNHNAYIVPGLGDAGDRIFNTVETHNP